MVNCPGSNCPGQLRRYVNLVLVGTCIIYMISIMILWVRTGGTRLCVTDSTLFPYSPDLELVGLLWWLPEVDFVPLFTGLGHRRPALVTPRSRLCSLIHQTWCSSVCSRDSPKSTLFPYSPDLVIVGLSPATQGPKARENSKIESPKVPPQLRDSF